MQLHTSLARQLVAEGIGTALLLATVIGSGTMAERLSGGNVALALLANAAATGAMLVVLISIFGPMSGAHFNPVVSGVFALRRTLSAHRVACFAAAQLVGAIAGVALAHAMFEQPILALSTTPRSGAGQWLSEMVATFGLVVTVLGTSRLRGSAYAVGLYIAAAYWFTASTSFANPVATIARSLTGTWTGIAPIDAPAFIAAEVLGGLGGALLFGWLERGSAAALDRAPETKPS